MGLADLMDWLESYYITGCQAYYAKMPSDSWHQAHEDMIAEVLSTKGFDEQNEVIAKYKKTFDRLLFAYKKSGPQLKHARPWDGFYVEERGMESMSTHGRWCIECGERDHPLKIITVKRTSLPALICKECL